MVVWLEYLVSRGHESSHTCNHGEVCRHFFTLWDLTFLWNLKERTREKFLRCSQWCLPVTLRINNFPVSWWWKKVRWKFSMHIFLHVCSGITVVDLHYTLFCMPQTHTHTHTHTHTQGLWMKSQGHLIWVLGKFTLCSYNRLDLVDVCVAAPVSGSVGHRSVVCVDIYY